MTFDNGRTIIALRLRLFIATVLLIVYLYLVYFGKELRFPLLGLEAGAWTTIVLAIFTIIAFYPLALNYRYFYFSDDGPVLVFRYYSVGFFAGKKQSVEIPKNEFAGYKTENYLGLFKKIILARKIDRKIAYYPLIHLSSLKKKEIVKLLSSLDSFSQSK